MPDALWIMGFVALWVMALIGLVFFMAAVCRVVKQGWLWGWGFGLWLWEKARRWMDA